jgi:MerR family transcriptional regulator, mercuric resistance operon regulatory protein
VPGTPARRLRSAELARLAGVSADTLRHYERKGLLARAPRSANGYREYPAETCTRVRLVRRAVALGFTLDEIARILAVRDRGGAPCRSVRALAEEKLGTLEQRLAELSLARDSLQAVLRHWDFLLEKAPAGERAGLLDALEQLIEPGTPSPLVPPALQRKRSGEP